MGHSSGRRELLKWDGLMSLASALPEVGYAGSQEEVRDVAPARVVATEDAVWAALGTALRAPSSHNTQPWVVRLPEERTIDFYVDPTRKLPAVDPLDRQLLVSQGTFVETCAIALQHAGHRVTLETFPLGAPAAALSGTTPVFRLTLGHGDQASSGALFGAIATRHTNRRVYASRAIPAVDLRAVATFARAPGCELTFVTDPAKRKRLAELCRQAMALDVSATERNVETATWFRFSGRELEEKGDGFGIGQNGITGVSKWVAETFFLSRARAADPKGSFARKSVELTGEQAASAAAFAVLTTAADKPSEQLRAGRAYVRAQLGAEALGIRTQPLSQILQDYPAMAGLRAELTSELALAPGTTVQMLFRLGYAAPTSPSPRRPLAAFVRNSRHAI